MLMLSVNRKNIFMLSMVNFILSMSLGCGSDNVGGGNISSVSGTVMFNGKPVMGEVVFQWADKKENVSLIGSDGKYNVINPEKGLANIIVRKIGGTVPTVKAEGMPELPGTTRSVVGVLPPSKYEKPTSELTFTFKGGKETFNIELK